MAAPVVASSAGDHGTPTAVVPVPSGVAVGSLLVALVHSLHNGGTGGSYGVTPPAGWTQVSREQQEIATDIQGVVTWFYKRATAADTGTYSFSQTGGIPYGTGALVMRVTGAIDTGSPFEDFYTAPHGDPVTIPAFTADGANRLALGGGWYYSTSTTVAPAGWSLVLGVNSDDGNRYAAYSLAPGTGSTGPTTFDGGADQHISLATLAPVASTVLDRTATGPLTLAAGATVDSVKLVRSATGTLSLSGLAEQFAALLTRTAAGLLGLAGAGTGDVVGDVLTRTAAGALSLAGQGVRIVEPTSRWYDALRYVTSQQARILWVGDSLLEGGGVSVRTERVIEQTTAKIRARYGIAGQGDGYLPPFYSEWSTIPDPATTTGTFVTTYGQGARAAQLAAGQYVQWAGVNISAVDVVYRDAPSNGELQVTIDGVAAGTIPPGASIQRAVQRRFETATGTHTVRVTAVGGPAVIEGIVCYRGEGSSSGLISWDAAHVGYASNDYGIEQTAGWANIDPDLVFYDLMGNNYLEGGPGPATAAADFKNYVGSLGPILPTIVVLPAPRVAALEGPKGGYTFEQYVDAMKAAAAEVGALVFDATVEYPDVNFDTAGYMGDDGLHMNTAGQAAYAAMIDEWLAAQVQYTPRHERTADGALTVGGTAARTLRSIRTALGQLMLDGAASGGLAEDGLMFRDALGELLTGASFEAAITEFREALAVLRLDAVMETSRLRVIGPVLRLPGQPGGVMSARTNGDRTAERLWNKVRLTNSIVLLKNDGLYRAVFNPTAEEIDAADVAYFGGRDHLLDENEQIALTEAGYGAYIQIAEVPA